MIIFLLPAVLKCSAGSDSRLYLYRTKEVLENAKEFVAKVFELDHEGAEEFAKAKAEALGIKLGDFMTLTTRERGCFINFL